MKYEIRFEVKNLDGSIKMWSRRGYSAVSAEECDTFIAKKVSIEVYRLGKLIDKYNRGK